MDLIEGNLPNPIKHWYYAHKYRSILKLISIEIPKFNTIIDVGAGSALFSLELLREYDNLSCVAIDTGYRSPEMHNKEQRISYFKDGTGKTGDFYLFTDVLEHVSDDVSMLSFYVETAPVGAKFLITVPAFMSLWSGHDVFLKHYRRYTKKQIVDCVSKTGLKIIKSDYLYVSLFLPVWIVRQLPNSNKIDTQMRDHGKLVNSIVLYFLKLDSLLRKLLPCGVSILVLAEKI